LRSATAAAALLTLLLGTGARVAVSRAADGARGAPDGAIDSVVVFVDRARVTRLGSAACDQGTAKVTFARLPATLDPRTLRGEAHDAAEVIGLVTDQVNEAQASDPRARTLAEQQRRIQTDMRANDARLAGVSAELDEVSSYTGVFGATLAEEMRNPRPDTAAWNRVLESFRDRRASLDDQRRKLDVELRALRLQADRIARELAHLGGGG
jgi:hypothetical protein